MLLGKKPEEELPDLMVGLFWYFEEPPRQLHHLTFPPVVCSQEFQFPHTLTSACCLAFLMTAVLTGVRRQPAVVFTSLMLDEVERLFMCRLAICMSSLEKCLWSSSAIFLSFVVVIELIKCQKNLPATQETWVRSSGWEDPLEKRMATYSRILAWRIPQTEEPGGLQSMGVTTSQTQPSN